ncbi:MAG: hypothetical protein K8T10_14305 [Candidatus Eremiobacteraeota bacterium]|nr:hypothetical protein [Candidatus Eremiobacteraeota bacterium]
MEQWWSAIPAFEKIFWYFAIPSTIIFFIQLVMFLIGGDHGDMADDANGIGDISDAHDFDHDMDHDMDHGGGHELGDQASFRVFTFRNIIILFACFGWSGIAGLHSGFSKFFTVLVALAIGVAVALMVAGLFYLFTKLQGSGTMDIKNALDAVGTVYLPIPAKKSATGMVQVPVQGSIRELQAMTDGPKLATGTKVKVISIVDQETVMVDEL